MRFADVDGDQEPEIAGVVRSVGSGGYVSADAFRYHLRSLQLIASVSDLEPEADPVMALRELFNLSDVTGKPMKYLNARFLKRGNEFRLSHLILRHRL